MQASENHTFSAPSSSGVRKVRKSRGKGLRTNTGLVSNYFSRELATIAACYGSMGSALLTKSQLNMSQVR